MTFFQECMHPDHLDYFMDRSVMQVIFDKAVSGVLKQRGPSYDYRSIKDPFVDMVASYFTNPAESIDCRSPVGHLLNDCPEMMEKYGFPRFGWWSINDWPDELIDALMPGAAKFPSLTYSRRFLSNLEEAHTQAFVVYKKAKGKINFNEEFIEWANKVAQGWCLKEINYSESLHG